MKVESQRRTLLLPRQNLVLAVNSKHESMPRNIDYNKLPPAIYPWRNTG